MNRAGVAFSLMGSGTFIVASPRRGCGWPSISASNSQVDRGLMRLRGAVEWQ